MNKHNKQTNRYLSPRGGSQSLLFGAMLLVAPLAFAQDDAEDDEIFELSPFEVTGNEREGYKAVDTLAGNRLNTELRDIGSAISVVTTQFLEDTGATDNKTLLQYTVGTEVGSIEGNYAGVGDGALLNEQSQFINPSANTRVRGLTSADNSRDYFISDIPWDGYNVDRVELQRGPNSILFGQGSPAGLINVGLQGASFSDEGKVEVRFDQHGSTRYSVNLNQAVIEDELAVRLAAVYDDEKYKQDPAFNRDERVYAALRWDPSFLNGEGIRTTFKANYEEGEVKSNNPRSIPPIDLISPWFQSGTYEGGFVYNETTEEYEPTRTFNHLDRETFNPFQLQDDNTGRDNHGQQRPSINGGPRTGQANPAFNPWIGNFGQSFGGPIAYWGNSEGAPNYFLSEWRQRRGINEEGVVTPDQGIVSFHRQGGINTQSAYARQAGLPFSDFGVYKNYNMTDPTAFDFYNNLLDGPNKSEWQDFDSLNLNLSQTYLNDQIGWELAHNQQTYNNGQLSLLTDSRQAIYIDFMSVYSDGTPDGLNGEPYQDGTPNPNVGRAFISDSGQNGNSTFESDRESTRLTLFATYDFTKNGDDSSWRRILGSHTFTGLLSQDERDTDSRNFQRYAVLDPSYREFVGAVDSNKFTDNLFAVNPVIYMGPSLSNRSSLSGANLPALKDVVVAPSGNIRIFDSTWAHPLDPTAAGYVNPSDPWINNYYLPPSEDYADFDPNDPLRLDTSTEDPDDLLWPDRRESTQNLNPENYVGWVDYPFAVTDSEAAPGNRDRLTTGARLERSRVESKALVWQGQLFDGALVGTWGIREDTAEGWSVSRNTDSPSPYTLQYGHLNLDPEVYSLEAPDGNYSVIEETSKSWSAVAHLNDFLDDSLPLDVSLFYSNSTNFQPEALRVDVYGEPIALPQGETTDMGILFESKEGRYSLRINKYETKVQNANSGGLNGAWFLGAAQAWSGNWVNRFEYDWTGDTIENAVEVPDETNSQYNYGTAEGETLADAQAREAAAIAAWRQWQSELDPRFYEAWGIDLDAPLDAANPRGLSASNPNGFQLSEDSVSKGYEIEFSAQPRENWSVIINAAKTKATRNNIGGTNLSAYVAAYEDTLRNTAAGDLRIWWGGAGNETALFQWNSNVGSEWTSRKLQEGTNAPELREWRVNMITNYDFTDGAFKGLNVGGGLRWQDEVVIGYRPIQGETATQVSFDIDNPYLGGAETNLDLWVGYQRKLTDRIDWKVQLNVRNAFQGEGLIPITTQPDGTPAGYRIAPAETWSLRNTFEF
ncbi:TonB-dependent receptor plug domain-containing protein [Pelagicoccus sp. SDUM812002]|uniref:TonB-dependent receptor plug domain-containing protein n=1 Tax=Pelagicoccus sp. SDUM812002 TaxID=3041266 RepID=UPI00280D5649|nr:TonB-dependent receptor plug domain-containing protein [Pelagicoccus sp. SDUM812002]MDQ8188260.1 TonB-dependent receptor plug domain-containing protein [Pelagicoccus sp. SDUM812002]